ncbi:PCI-domain-containing protein [Rickenella mellea]|uniref:Eukaryotic translation initiation factor 3 subunit M n=1 Tax=Rickenella mellea TaxID=50990 RepID=A0A4R5XGB9_9AGAM|nr:PCI-domain-containing protein [Rickenella mellea]
MSAADSISIFAEGTFEEQTQELVNYIARSRPENERPAFIRPFQELLKTAEGQKALDDDIDRRRRVVSLVVSELKGLGDGSDREIEGFFNLLYSHLLSLYPADSTELSRHISAVSHLIADAPPPSDHTALRYKALTNLFNAVPRRSSLRLLVCTRLLRLAADNDELDVLHLTPIDTERWINEWDISQEERASFLKSIVDAFEQVDQMPMAYNYSILYVRSIPLSSPLAETAALETVSLALRLPSIFDFDSLLKLSGVQKLSGRPIFALLKIFTEDGLAEYETWQEKYRSTLEEHGLDSSQLERKMRLLVLASLGLKYVGRDIPYSEIASNLQIEISQVEGWVIDVIRAGLLSGKLSQTTQTLHVTRSTARSFSTHHWEALEKRLLVWKTGLAGTLEVVTSARRNALSQQGPNVATVPERVVPAQTQAA